MKKSVLIAGWILFLPLVIWAQNGGDTASSNAGNITFSGKVLAEKTNSILSGATVHIKGTTHEVLTDKKGGFSFLTGQHFPVVITVSHVGYVSQDVTVKSADPVTVILDEATSALEEVVVVGYGTQKRKGLIGSVSKVNPSETKNIPAGGFDAQLQGKAAGVQVSSNTGVPGEVVNIRLRGATSINADNTPLYVIDGVFVNSSSLQTINTGGKATSPIADINPSDIQTIEILKDAEATALYGSRGANGVIIVTTKRGNFNQRPKLSLDAAFGSAWAPPLWELTTGPEHAQLVNENWVNTGGDPTKKPFRPVSEGGRGLPEEQQTYDRLDQAFHTAQLANVNLSLSGGNNGTKYYIGGGYNKQESILIPITFERASFKVNIDQKINDKVLIGTSNSITRAYRNQGRAGDGPAGGILQAALHTPTYLSPYNEQGVLVGRAGFDNLTLLQQYYDVHSVSLHYIGNLFLDAEILPGLKFRSSFGVDYNNYDEEEYWNSYLISGSPNGLATSTISQNSSWLNEQTLSWQERAGKHSFGVLVGNTLQSNVYERTYLEGRGFANNSFTKISSATTIAGTQNWSKNTLASFFGKVNYGFDDKYLVDFSIRADGSSKFGDNRKWGYFPSVGAAWRIKQENFLKEVDQITELKLRASYGITGNQNGIGDFAAEGLWTGGAPYQGNAGISPLQLANGDLRWEKTSQFNIGVDLGLFKNRLAIEFNYYYKYTEDGLLQVALPATTGFSSYWSNAAEISNKGFELNINSVNITNKNFTWTTNLNIAQNINNIEKLSTPLQYGSRSLILQQEGSPLYSFWVYKELYVDPQTGNSVYEDVNKDGKRTAADRTVYGSIWPKFFGGFNNTVTWKGFDLGIFFSFQYGNKTYNHNRFFGEGGGARDAARIIFAHNNNRWQKPGDITDVPKPDGVNVNNYLDGGSRWLEDGSFIRLRSLTLGYTIPGRLTSRVGIENARFFVQGSNLFLITKYTGPDPESSANSSQNQVGIDLGTPPQPRSIQFGVSVTL